MKNERLWALAGVLGGLVGFVGLFVGSGFSGDVGDGIKDNALVVDAVAEQRGYVWLTQVACFVAASLLVVFAAGLKRHLARQEPAGSLVPPVAGAGVGLVAVLLLVGGGMCTELYWALGEAGKWDPDTIAGLVEVYNTLPWLWAGAGIAAVAVAVGGFKHGSAGKWLAVVSAIAALLVVATQVYPAQYGALFPGALWTVVAGIGFLTSGRTNAPVN
ncbi:hypothetical protein ACQP00_05985 [Dactylosporangium sp. CS-047395]|uniref:hypothetical protein n=1 Tax=Dactylosporangium sp. CS-047395 TaxID=3239936 RepID=UPI003D8A1037